MNWIKYSTNLHDKPRVQRIADELGISRFDAAGRLCAVWVWADTMTDDGRIAFGSLKQVDRAAELDGFGEAMKLVGWLAQDGEHIVIPGWEEHHSKSAKRRLDGARRAAKNRVTTAESEKRAQRAHEKRTKCAPREEKRREEKSASSDDDAYSEPAAASAEDGLRFKSKCEAMIARTGFPTPDGRSLDELRKAADRIRFGVYPEAIGIEDPIEWLEPRLKWYWDDQAARRADAEKRLAEPSLRKTLAEDRWRVDLEHPIYKPNREDTDEYTRRLIDST